jgi:putative ABC transport system substrate-binding protein
MRIDTRWASNDADNGRKYAAELIALAPDVILAGGSLATSSLLQATRAVPIVFAVVPDPVGAGYVDSLARPGGNANGFASIDYSMGAKWLELLKEIAPGVTRVAVLRDPAVAAGAGQFGGIQSAASSTGVEVSPINARDAGEIERAMMAFARSSNGGLIVTSTASAQAHATSCRRSTSNALSSQAAAWCAMGVIWWIRSGARPNTSIASSKARSPPTFRSRRRPGMSC